MSTDYASFRLGLRYQLYKSFANRISLGDGRTNEPAMTSHGRESANKSSPLTAIDSVHADTARGVVDASVVVMTSVPI